ncbi:MAG: hypothetical protein ACK4NC_07455, partial [Candidatus Gracilibacteria bacterium]
KTTTANRQSAGIPDRTLTYSPIAEAANKRVWNTIVQTANIPVIKLAYQELVTLEAERNLDAATFITDVAITKLFEMVHAYITQILAGAILPAAFWPGAGTYPQPNILSVLHWISERYSTITTDCRDRVYVFLDRASTAQYKAIFDVATGYWNKSDLERMTQIMNFVSVHPHDIDGGWLSPAAHNLAGPRQSLIVPSDGYFLAMDSDVTLYRDHLPTTNQTVITAEMFLSVLPIRQLNSIQLTGVSDHTLRFDVATALSNV